MNTNRDPKELAIDLLPRSTCSVQVSAIIADRWGIFSWGTNHVGFDGYGRHAEIEAIRRANKRRLRGATIYVASQRNRNRKAVFSKPCPDCQRVIDSWGLDVVYRERDDWWIDG